MSKETEKRYLVNSDDWRAKAGPGKHLRQGYLSTDPERSVRIRLDGDAAAITVKGDPKGPSRSEYEYKVPTRDAQQLLDGICLKPIIEKTRYTLKLNGFAWEIDEYAKENEGLTVVEVEFDGKPPRTKPEWAGREISGDQSYSNANLVAHPFSKWQASKIKDSAKFHLKHKESISDGLLRVQDEQLHIAAGELTSKNGNLDESVHEARKAIKKVRSVLRLMRPILPALYQQENRELQGVGRKLSQLRDAQALIGSLADLRKRYQEQLKRVELSSIEAELVRLKNHISKAMASPEELPNLVKTLNQVQARMASSDLKPVDALELTQSLAETVRRGRKAGRVALDERTPESFHEWRKRTKDLRYQLDLLHKLWPGVLSAFTDSAESLEQRLGDHHNLAVLRQTLLNMPDGLQSTKDLRKLLQVIDLDRTRLEDEAHAVGTLLFAEKPKIWIKRLDTCWASWRKQN